MLPIDKKNLSVLPIVNKIKFDYTTNCKKIKFDKTTNCK